MDLKQNTTEFIKAQKEFNNQSQEFAQQMTKLSMTLTNKVVEQDKRISKIVVYLIVLSLLLLWSIWI